MADCVKNKVKGILKIDGVDDEFILAYYCPSAVVLKSGDRYYYVNGSIEHWQDTKNKFPLEDLDDDFEDESLTMYHHEKSYVYISRKGKILVFSDDDNGCSDPNYEWDREENTIEDGFKYWMWGYYIDELNDPDKVYILDMRTDHGDHYDYVLIDDPSFVEKVGMMPKNCIYQTVQDYISQYDVTGDQASHEVIKDGKVYDYEEYKALK